MKRNELAVTPSEMIMIAQRTYPSRISRHPLHAGTVTRHRGLMVRVFSGRVWIAGLLIAVPARIVARQVGIAGSLSAVPPESSLGGPG